jgi:hypothetical protein
MFPIQNGMWCAAYVVVMGQVWPGYSRYGFAGNLRAFKSKFVGQADRLGAMRSYGRSEDFHINWLT